MRRAFTLVEFLVVLAILGILAAILYPTFHRTHCSSRDASCYSQLKQIGLGFKQYIQDYDEKYPLAKMDSKTTWTTSLQPYMKSWQVFECPSAKPSPKQKVGSKMIVGKTTDYFYNSRFSGFNQTKLAAAQSTILAGDGADNASLGSSISQLPVDWQNSPTAPSRRHPFPQDLTHKLWNRDRNRAMYLFADGHTKPMTPEKITLDKPNKSGIFTFLTR